MASSCEHPKPTKKDLLESIESDRQSHIGFLQKIIQAKSPNPPGDTTEVAKVVSSYLEEHSIPFEILSLRDEFPNIVADFYCEFGDRNENNDEFEWDFVTGDEVEGKRLVFNGHMDVFPVSEEDSKHWKHGPWSGAIDSGYMYGRGTVDMKAGTTAIIIAYRYLYQLQAHYQHKHQQSSSHQLYSTENLRRTTPSSLALTVVSDEETGSKYGTEWLLSDAFSEEGEGGKSKWLGTTMLNPEPSSLRTIRFGEKGTLRLTFRVRTPTAHGAYMHLGPGAIRIAVSLITSLLSLESLDFPSSLPKRMREHMEKKEVKQVVDEVMGEGASGILGKVTVNVGKIWGGEKVNVIPGECGFEVDVRIPIGVTRDSILSHIESQILPQYPEAMIKVQEEASHAPSFSAMDHPIVGIFKKNARFVGLEKSKEEDVEILGDGEGKGKTAEKEGGLQGEVPLEIYGIGATDSKFWRYAGIPAYSYGVSPETMAARDERVEIEQFMDLIRMYVLSAWEFLGGGR